MMTAAESQHFLIVYDIPTDSLETVKRTHSSYFQTEETFESLLPAGVLSR